MKRSGTIHTIHELSAQGKSIHAIARELGIAHNTVRRYLRGKPEAVPRPKRSSVLDPYKAQIQRFMQEDHLYNCEAMLERLREQGYKGNGTILRDYVRPFRPCNVGHQPVMRYETKPGEQMQYDWGEVHYEHKGHDRKLYGFTAVLGYSRMRFITFVKRCDTPTMIRCMMEAFEYFGGLPKAALTDRMKSVFLQMEDEVPKWNPLFSDFMASLGVAPRVCKPYKPQTKGKVERSVGVIKNGFWPGVRFRDIDDLNEQAKHWCDRFNPKVHRTTRRVPLDLWVEENLAPLPKDYAWERYGSEERRVSWDGFISYDGVLYGLPAHPPVAGSVVLVRERHRTLRVYQQGQLIATLAKQPRSQEIVFHPEQFAGVSPAPSIRRTDKPLGHQVEAPTVAVRPLSEYDLLLGPPGVGKTHLSLALAVKALEADYSVLFTTLSSLAEDLAAVPHPSLRRQGLRRYLTPRVLVIDEIGYTKLTPEQSQSFFELVRDRYEKGPIILTSNTSFSEWGSLLNDEILATALLDRLLHHAEVITISGKSFRMKDRVAKGEKTRAAAAKS